MLSNMITTDKCPFPFISYKRVPSRIVQILNTYKCPFAYTSYESVPINGYVNFINGKNMSRMATVMYVKMKKLKVFLYYISFGKWLFIRDRYKIAYIIGTGNACYRSRAFYQPLPITRITSTCNVKYYYTAFQLRKL